MIDIERQVAHWRESAVEDLAVGRDLIARQKPRHGLFFVHLALEKTLKALVCRATGETPPKIHNLVRLSELARIDPTQQQMDTLADMTVFNIEGRYAETLPSFPTQAEVQGVLRRAEEVFRWLIGL
jgi:HEPN domain-containing protein